MLKIIFTLTLLLHFVNALFKKNNAPLQLKDLHGDWYLKNGDKVTVKKFAQPITAGKKKAVEAKKSTVPKNNNEEVRKVEFEANNAIVARNLTDKGKYFFFNGMRLNKQQKDRKKVVWTKEGSDLELFWFRKNPTKGFKLPSVGEWAGHRAADVLAGAGLMATAVAGVGITYAVSNATKKKDVDYEDVLVDVHHDDYAKNYRKENINQTSQQFKSKNTSETQVSWLNEYYNN